ncbi:MAG TPA: helix-turn-helix domain-containing protein [Treponemataceae bacterium]|jgi:predicted transcriptional regulator|nr:helix-turn-helix domain-containing protein [Treponema sp.]HOF85280.1 helix-turn-helix domain-containing protein [Treponemataceae bacterium]HOS35454.1 helix-turn-helix domain-containing protein [Treponemataceae bacterium]HOU37467.1 helix-turn-helix domain-containing protein [Treponemataceae bacterium]HPA09417.1 helix-turn-helix domain-containing protein [Treponemataceae bacterium]
MRDINTHSGILTLSKALSSPVRLQMLKTIAERRQINLNELAEAVNVTNGAITQHMKPLLEADLVEFIYTSGKRGSQKICTLKDHLFMIDILSDLDHTLMYETEIPIGTFTQYLVLPTCGIATQRTVIGEVDEPRYFDDPSKKEAGILWFTKGFVEYRIPNYLKDSQTLEELQISFEICSEAPGVCSNWPSDIYFSINGIDLGFWTSPGDFGGAVKGLFTPEWWDENWNSYGLLKLLTINNEGTYIDGGKISDINTVKLGIDSTSPITFRVAVPDTAAHVGGCTLFGKGFGNYNQDIKVRTIFSEE